MPADLFAFRDSRCRDPSRRKRFTLYTACIFSSPLRFYPLLVRLTCSSIRFLRRIRETSLQFAPFASLKDGIAG